MKSINISKQQKIFLCLHSLYERKTSIIFREPIQLSELPHYKQHISTPICLSQILMNYKQNKYKKCIQIYSDLILIARNCISYHKIYNAQHYDKIKIIVSKYFKSVEVLWYALMRQLMKNQILPRNRDNQVRNNVIQIDQSSDCRVYDQLSLEYLDTCPTKLLKLFNDCEIRFQNGIAEKINQIENRRKNKIANKLKRMGIKQETILTEPEERNCSKQTPKQIVILDSTQSMTHTQKCSAPRKSLRNASSKIELEQNYSPNSLSKASKGHNKLNNEKRSKSLIKSQKNENIVIKIEPFTEPNYEGNYIKEEDNNLQNKSIEMQSIQKSVKSKKKGNNKGKLKGKQQQVDHQQFNANKIDKTALNRRLRKYKISLRKQLQFIYNKIIPVCANEKISRQLQLPWVLRGIMQSTGVQIESDLETETISSKEAVEASENQNQIIIKQQIYDEQIIKSQSSQKTAKKYTAKNKLEPWKNIEKIKLLQQIFTLNFQAPNPIIKNEEQANQKNMSLNIIDPLFSNRIAIHKTIQLLVFATKYLSLYRLTQFKNLGSENKKYAYKIIQILISICGQFRFCKELEYLKNNSISQNMQKTNIVKKFSLTFIGYGIEISSQFEKYILNYSRKDNFECQNEIHTPQFYHTKFHQAHQMDEFVIETNLVYIENKNNGRYMTLDEANYVKKLSRKQKQEKIRSQLKQRDQRKRVNYEKEDIQLIQKIQNLKSNALVIKKYSRSFISEDKLQINWDVAKKLDNFKNISLFF